MLCLSLGTKFTWKVKCLGLKYLFDHQKLGGKLFPGLLKDIQIACVHWFAALLRPPPPLDITVINMWCNCDVAIINISMVRSLWHVSMWTYQLFAEMLPTNIFPGDWAGQDKTLSFPGDFHTLTFPQHEHRVVPTQNWKTNTKKHKVSTYPVSQCIKMSNSRCRFRC